MSWWGEHEFDDGQTRVWRLGPFAAWVERVGSEFRLSWRRESDPDSTALVAAEPTAERPPDDCEVVRFGLGEKATALLVQPAAPDRAVVVKSETPFVVPPGGATTAYVSSPVWMQLRQTKHRHLLWEDALLRPSDTWFGPSTLAGELCYAIRTAVRYRRENLQESPHRVVSVVRILNRAGTILPLERIRLPMAQLSLYADADDRLWTESLTLERTSDGDDAVVKLGRSAPREAGPCSKVAEPRETPAAGSLIRSFRGILGIRKGGDALERMAE